MPLECDCPRIGFSAPVSTPSSQSAATRHCSGTVLGCLMMPWHHMSLCCPNYCVEKTSWSNSGHYAQLSVIDSSDVLTTSTTSSGKCDTRLPVATTGTSKPMTVPNTGISVLKQAGLRPIQSNAPGIYAVINWMWWSVVGSWVNVSTNCEKNQTIHWF